MNGCCMGMAMGNAHDDECWHLNGNINTSNRLTEFDDLLALATAAVSAHRALHETYANTTACSGGIGGQAFTQHCGVTCGYSERHEAENSQWHDVETAFFRRKDGDPEWAEHLPGRRLSTSPGKSN